MGKQWSIPSRSQPTEAHELIHCVKLPCRQNSAHQEEGCSQAKEEGACDSCQEGPKGKHKGSCAYYRPSGGGGRRGHAGR